MRRNRLLWLFALVFAALLVLALFQAPTKAPSSLPPTVDLLARRIFPELSATDLVALRLEDPLRGYQATLSLTEQGEWALDGSTLGLNQAVLSSIVATVVQLPYLNTLSSNTDLGQYGLSTDELSLLIAFITRDRQQYAIAIGALSSDEQGYYALVDAHDDLYILPRNATEFLGQYLREIHRSN